MAQACHRAQQANIWRLELLNLYGGVYADTDIEPLKNIEPLLDGASAVASPFAAQVAGKTAINNAFLASEPGHPWIVDSLAGIAARDPKVHKSMGSSLVTATLASHPEVKVLDKHDIYQSPSWYKLSRIREPNPKWSAIHWFSYQWYPTGFERLP
jgi:mannosyltransferase OCH1-like enzyme